MVCNAAYNLHSREEENTYNSVVVDSTLPPDNKEEDLDLAAGRDVSVKEKKVRRKCYAVVTIIALVMAVLSLIVALVGVSYVPIELNNQQGQLSSSSQGVESQINRIQLSNEQCKILITDLHTKLNNSNRMFQAQLNHLNQQIQVIFQNIIPTLRLGTLSYPVSSCSDIPQYQPSGEYWIATNSTSSPVQVYCDMDRTSCSCNTTGGWMRVANLDMIDSNQNCPDGFRLVNRTTPSTRTCGRPGPAGCVSTTYPTYGVEYSRVCGRVIGYQDKSPDAFAPYFVNTTVTIDDVYVDSVSLTHGQSPHQHIWTFANANDETKSDHSVCPCTRPDRNYTGVVPPFIGQNYFCETGSRQAYSFIFYSDDPVWDGQGCGSNSTCCQFNNPPWFCKQLPHPTTNDIELRICGNQHTSDEDTPLEIVEIFVQ